MSVFVKDPIRLEDVYIPTGRWRNFSGQVTDVNRTGDRKFNIFLPQDLAEHMKELGWYVKYKDPYREGDDGTYFIEVNVSWKKNPPVIKLISSDGTSCYLDEDNVDILDSTDIQYATVELNPYNWEFNGKTGCTAYLGELDVTAKPPRMSYRATLHRNEDDD